MKEQLFKQLISKIGIAILIATSACTNTTTEPGKNELPEKNKFDTISRQYPVTTGETLPAEKEVGNAWLLVPGQAAGLTHLNEDAAEVNKRLGNADGGDAAMQKAVSIWYTNHDSTNHSVAIYTAREPGADPVTRIQQIRVTSPNFKTAAGVGSGSTITDIRKVFRVSQTEQYNDAGANYKVYDSPEGIAFEINPGGRCVAVVIHEAGVTGQGTYLKFRTTNKFFGRKKE